MRAADIKYLTRDELTRFFSKITDKRDRALFNLIYKHGLRASEAGELERKDIDLDNRKIAVMRLKGGLSGTYPLFPDSARLLKAYLETRNDLSPTLFLSRKKNPISRQRIAELFRLYAKKARIPEDKRHVHTLRHSIAVHLVEAGQDILLIKDWLGHKNIQNTTIYAQVTNPARDRMALDVQRSGAIVIL